jgi:hypothetical protein
VGDLINLRQVRKRKARADKDRVAEQNRLSHGRTKSERQRLEAEARRAAAFVDGHRRAAEPGDTAE